VRLISIEPRTATLLSCQLSIPSVPHCLYKNSINTTDKRQLTNRNKRDLNKICGGDGRHDIRPFRIRGFLFDPGSCDQTKHRRFDIPSATVIATFDLLTESTPETFLLRKWVIMPNLVALSQRAIGSLEFRSGLDRKF